MSAFQTGVQMGASAFDSSEQSRRQKILDERAARDDAQKQEDRARIEESFVNLENVGNGIGDQGQQLKDT